MNHTIDAVYENGTFRPLQPDQVGIAEGQQVRLTIDDHDEPAALQQAARVYEGLSEQEIDQIEQIALDRGDFFRNESAD